MHKNKLKFRIFLLVTIGFSPLSKAQQLDPILKELITKGLEKSHLINIHNLDSKQTKIDQQLAKAVFLPKVTFSSSFTRLDDNITFDDDTQNLLISTQKLLIKEAVGIPFNDAFPSSIPLSEIPNLQDKNILKSYVDLDWVLFSGFEVTNAIKASKHKEASLNYITIAEKDKIALKIIETYDKLALVYASKLVLNTSEKYLNEQEFYVKKAIKNGLAIPINRKKIELAKLQLAAKELEYSHNKSLLIEVLHQLTNESRESLTLVNPTLQSFSFDTSKTKKRNEVKALEEAEKATLYKSKMEKSNFIPKIALKGHYEFIEDDLSLLDPKWYVGVGIKWNAFDGFNSSLKSKKSKIESKKYREKITDANEMIALSIIKAKLTYESSLENTKIVKKEIELASDTYRMINKQYQNNLASINDVLDAINDLEKPILKYKNPFTMKEELLPIYCTQKELLNTNKLKEITKMKSFRNIFISSILLLTLSSCESDKTITYNRGKIKFETIAVSNKLAGRIYKIYVKEGQSVKKGDTLALLDIPEVNAKMMQAEGAVTAAKGLLNMASNGATIDQLNQINSKINASKAQLNFAQESYNRLQNMYKDSLISLQQFDEVKMKRDMAKAQVSALEAKRNEVNKSVRIEQLDQAKGQLKRALGAQEEVLTAAKEKFVIAPANMSIETISLHEGELLTPGYSLFNGYKKNSVFFRFTIPESKIYDFEIGKSITLINPFTKEEIVAKIASIKQLAQYANITSTAPLYNLSESIYELKAIATSDISKQKFYLNATILIK